MLYLLEAKWVLFQWSKAELMNVSRRIPYKIYEDWPDDDTYTAALILLDTGELDVGGCLFWFFQGRGNSTFVSQTYNSRLQFPRQRGPTSNTLVRSVKRFSLFNFHRTVAMIRMISVFMAVVLGCEDYLINRTASRTKMLKKFTMFLSLGAFCQQGIQTNSHHRRGAI